jgi:poly-gamma-glutamate capsule biosynthesis protein CapA/YwtB (metallophosphatase superfamily)
MHRFFRYAVPLITAAVLYVAVMFLPGCGQQDASAAVNETPPKTAAAPTTPSPQAAPSPTPLPPPDSAALLFAGDVITFGSQITNHKFGSSYDYTDDYKYIRDIVSAADIAAVNLETVLSGKPPYKGFPRFNTPDSIADALGWAGFDVIATANNHSLDQGSEAMKRSSSYLRGLGFTVIGTAHTENEPKYALVEAGGIKVGFVNFSNTTNRGYPGSAEPHLNCMKHTEGGYEAGYAAMSEEIAALRGMGAEFIVTFMHWGNQYKLKNTKEQKEEAGRIADLGVDLIIGNHPHVLQNVAEYTSPVTGKNVLIYYSIGNFVSNQLYSQAVGGGHCETGMLAIIKLLRGEDGTVSIDSAGFITTYTHKPDIKKIYTEDGETHTKKVRAFYIVPAARAVMYPEEFEGAEGTLLKHIRKGMDNGSEIVGRSGAGLRLFDFSEFIDWPW